MCSLLLVGYVPLFQVEVHAVADFSRLFVEESKTVRYTPDSKAAISSIKGSSRMTSANEAAFWIPDHVGIRDNDITDELAREETEAGSMGPTPVSGFP